MNQLFYLLMLLNVVLIFGMERPIERNRIHGLHLKSNERADEGIKIKLRSGERMIDWHGSQVIVVDQDDNVKIYFYSETGELERNNTVTSLGQAVYTSGPLNLSRFIPKNEIAVHARRVTNLEKGFTSHAIVTWGANKDKTPNAWPHFQYTIYVFHQVGDKVKKVYEERSKNTELTEFLVSDIDDDNLFEIVDRGYQLKIARLKIRQIQPNGTIKLLQEVEGRRILLIDSQAIRVEDGPILPWGDTHEEIEIYRWDKDAKRFGPEVRYIMKSLKIKDVIKQQFRWNRELNRWEEVEIKE